MTGYPDHNFHEFRFYHKLLTDLGHDIVYPFDIEQNGEDVLTRPYVIRLDVFLICGNGADDKPVDGVFVLRGWESSRGTRLEVELASQLNIPIYWAHNQELVTDNERTLASLQRAGLFEVWSPDTL